MRELRKTLISGESISIVVNGSENKSKVDSEIVHMVEDNVLQSLTNQVDDRIEYIEKKIREEVLD